MTTGSESFGLERPLGSHPHVIYDVDELVEDINGYIHGPVTAFAPKYFSKLDALYKCYVAQYTSQPPSAQHFIQSFADFLSTEQPGARGKWRTCCPSALNPNTWDASGDAYVFLTLSTKAFNLGSEDGWSDVQVIGHICRNSADYSDGFLRLCAFAQKVFAQQPTRLFLHGFYIHGTTMESWVFDRAGMYSCNVFDFQDDFARLLSTVASYQLMSDEDMGKSNVIEYDRTGNCVVRRDDDHWPRKLYLEERPFTARQALFGNGTSCYRARTSGSGNWEYAVKFKWRWARDRTEQDIFSLVKDQGVWGVVSLDVYREFISTAELRAGLRFGPHRSLVVEKRGPDKQDGIMSCTNETGGFFQNRILTCTVTSPLGRPLHTFTTRLELLEALRDAIQGHRSLFQSASILHQDISEGNVIITDAQGIGGTKGMLIDLDVAMPLTLETPVAGNAVGTRIFMSIGVLKKEAHTYRHDLESFLYVFLWTVIANRTLAVPVDSKLRLWTEGSLHDAALRKTVDMDEKGFRSILDEFPSEFHSLQPLAIALRRLLFPCRDGVIWTGTDSSPESVNSLYDQMIGAFEQALAVELRS